MIPNRPDIFRQLFLTAATVMTLAGCVSPGARLNATLRSAREAVLSVRPSAKLEDVRAEIWTASIDVASLLKDEAASLSFHELRRVVDAQFETLLQLDITTPGSLEQVRKELVRLDSDSVEGIALASRGLILVKEAVVGSEAVVAHELGHVAAARMGYTKRRDRISLRGGEELVPEWVDLDALIALWVLGEADAQFTARAAEAHRRDGQDAVDRLWGEPAEVNLEHVGSKITGAASLRYPDGTVLELKAGGEYIDPAGLLDALMYLAYDGSRATVVASHHRGESVESTLQRMWSAASFSTKELLFLGRANQASRLAGGARQRAPSLADSGVSGATRVGAFLVRELLVRRAHLSESQALEIAGALEDDLALQARGHGCLWLTEWNDGNAAKKFSDLYRLVLEKAGAKASLEIDGPLVTATAGDVPGREAILAALRE